MPEQSVEFIYLRPILIAFIVFLTASFLIILLQHQNKIINQFNMFSLILISVTVSSLTLFCEGYIVDTYGLGGDSITSYMWLAVIGLSLINIIGYYSKKEPQWKYHRGSSNYIILQMCG